MTISRRSFLGRTAGAYVAVATARGKQVQASDFNAPSMPLTGDYLYAGLMAGEREASYTGYGRVKLERNRGTWQTNAETNSVKTVKPVTFPECAGGRGTITGFAIYAAEGQMLFEGSIEPNIVVLPGVTVQLTELQVTL